MGRSSFVCFVAIAFFHESCSGHYYSKVVMVCAFFSIVCACARVFCFHRQRTLFISSMWFFRDSSAFAL
ncbi:hypothetical protein M407DRAFT_125060 [Tulasnella calospora MUT 4182]|uniref:Uncharacterized protein n=1 Tax=Tulasnella calospora MUT 4182 TaxID=1051891 RepID=A0A0C3QBC8_9AGAM|nr:hypothetical protein M407DRAFT_125060 [Tulasnella calospora MUT 4182]